MKSNQVKPNLGATPELRAAPRMKELDYDARPRSKTDRSCVKCQRDIKPNSPVRGVHVVEGGNMILHPNDESLYASDSGDMGHFIVGMDCAKQIGIEWTYSESTETRG